MKLNGKKIAGPNIEYIIIPRNDGDLVFKARAVLSLKRFEELCPLPKPGKKVLPGGQAVDDFEDVHYKEGIKQHNKRRWAFHIIESLKATEGLEWETVDYDNPNTWVNWEKELEDSGFTESEINLVQVGVATANTLNQAKLEEARQRFLLTLQSEPKQ